MQIHLSNNAKGEVSFMNLDAFRGFDYEPGDAEEETLLSEIPLELMKQSIAEQFANPMDVGATDYVQAFETR